MATKPTGAIAILRETNGNAYDASTNPRGLAQGGHRQNFTPALQAVADVGQYAADSVDETAQNALVAGEAATLAANARSATFTARDTTLGYRNQAETARNEAQGYAAGLNLPPVTSAVAGRYLKVNAAGTGYEAALLNFATSVQAKAGTASDVLMSPLGVKEAIAALGFRIVKQVFTTSGTFIKETDDVAYLFEAVGGGGPGYSRPSSSNSGSGGSGGAYASRFMLASEIVGSRLISIGAGGISGNALGSVGTEGGASSIQSILTAPGGSPGASSLHAHPTTSLGARAYTPDGTAGSLGFNYGAGGGTSTGHNQGRDTIYGGAGGAGTFGASASALPGGVSQNHGNGGSSGTNTITRGEDGVAPGGGGGSGLRGGYGARGEVIITRFKRVAA